MSLDELSTLVNYVEQLKDDLEKVDAEWKRLRAKIQKLEEVDIPLLMDELGFPEVKTKWHEVKVDDTWASSIPQYKRADVAAYAEELGVGSLVSHSLVQQFKNTEQDHYQAAKALLIQEQQPFKDELNINTGSWKKAVKELVALGETVDLERACVSRVRKAKISKRKDH